MAIECMSDVINARLAPWSKGDLTVLIMLANYADPDGTNIFPSVDRLARACRLTVRAVQICLRSLQLDGVLIEVEKQVGRRTTHYRLDMDRVAKFAGCKKCGGVICAEQGCKKQPDGVKKTALHIEDPSGPVINPSVPRAAGAVDSPAPRELWSADKARARELWLAVGRGLGNLKFLTHCAQGTPSIEDGALVVRFPSEGRASKAQNIIAEIERAAGVAVSIRVAA